MRRLEFVAREVAALIGNAIDDSMGDGHYGFMLMLFTFDGSETTYCSNAERSTMVKLLSEFISKNRPELTWDESVG